MSYAGDSYGEEPYAGGAAPAEPDGIYAGPAYAGDTYAGAEPSAGPVGPPTQAIDVGEGPDTHATFGPAAVTDQLPYLHLMGPASGRAGAPGLVRAPAPGPPPPPVPYGGRLTVRLYDHTYATELAELAGRHDVNWLDQLDDTGTHQFQLQNDDPEAPHIDYLRIAQYSLDDMVRFAGPIEHIKKHMVEPGEEHDEVYECDGRGVMAVLERALMYPEGGTDQQVYSDTRAFNFASRYYDASAWPPAVAIQQQKVTTSPQYGKIGAPAGWPDPDAWWIWGVPMNYGASPPAPVGDCYFVSSGFDVATDGTYRIYFTADDGIDVWVDNTLVASENQALLWNTTKTVDVFLKAGHHGLALKGTNIARDSAATNTAGVLASVYRLSTTSHTGLDPAPALRTDATWKCSPYPTQSPGFTIGAILRVLVAEAQARTPPSLPGLTLGFTDTTDSAGTPWPQIPDLSYQIGIDLLTLAKKLAEAGANVHMLPGALQLNAYVKRGGTQAVTLTPGVNLQELIYEGTA